MGATAGATDENPHRGRSSLAAGRTESTAPHAGEPGDPAGGGRRRRGAPPGPGAPRSGSAAPGYRAAGGAGPGPVPRTAPAPADPAPRGVLGDRRSGHRQGGPGRWRRGLYPQILPAAGHAQCPAPGAGGWLLPTPRRAGRGRGRAGGGDRGRPGSDRTPATGAALPGAGAGEQGDLSRPRSGGGDGEDPCLRHPQGLARDLAHPGGHPSHPTGAGAAGPERRDSGAPRGGSGSGPGA